MEEFYRIQAVFDINRNGRCVLQFCAANGLCIMITFFWHRKIHKCTWYKDSVGQRSIIDFCIISADLVSSVVDVCVKRIVYGSSSSRLHFKRPKPSKNKKTIQSTKSIQNNVGVTSRQKGETHFCMQSCFPVQRTA